MSGQMRWQSVTSNSTKILHVRNNSNEAWQPYNTVPGCNIKDYLVPQGSQGWAAYQHLRKQGWELLPSPQNIDTIGALNTLDNGEPK